MVAAVSVTCGNVDDGTGEIRAAIDAVHIRVDGAPAYDAEGAPKLYRILIEAQDTDLEPEVRSGLSELFTPDANGDHDAFPGGYIFPAPDTYDISLVDYGTVGELNIVSYTEANPTVITTDGDHGLQSGEEVTIAGETGGTPTINGTHVATVISATTFSVPVNVSDNAGTGGTVTSTGVVDRTEVEVV